MKTVNFTKILLDYYVNHVLIIERTLKYIAIETILRYKLWRKTISTRYGSSFFE